MECICSALWFQLVGVSRLAISSISSLTHSDFWATSSSSTQIYSGLCAQKSLQAGTGPKEMPKIELTSAICEAKALPTVLSI